MAHDGAAVALEASGGWANLDPIGGRLDARHVYPSLYCRDWAGLLGDLAELGAVSFAAIVFPVGVDVDGLKRIFPLVEPVKAQYVLDLAAPPAVSAHHRRSLRRAAETVAVEDLVVPADYADDFLRLYDLLRARHRIRGSEDYPAASLRAQLALASAVVFRALVDGVTVGMHLWLAGGGWAHYAIGAFDELGYRTGASHALVAHALAHFREAGVGYADLGRTPRPGVTPSADDGLARFKLGFGAEVRPAYLCGTVLDRDGYEQLCAERGRHDWFPAYRAGPPFLLNRASTRP